MVVFGSGVPALWRAMEALPAGAELLTAVLTCLDAASILALLQVEKRSRRSVRKIFTTFQRARGRLALASLCFARLRVEFQTYYQELETQNIPRSSDPRVPPRVVSIWAERGQVAAGSVTLKPVELPSVHKNGVTVRFVADANAPGNQPMLTNVVQRNRRLYTMVTFKLLRSGGAEGNSGDGLVLRSYSYLKEFGEWKTPTIPEKRMLAAASIDSRQGRFDLISQDGSVALELEVPSGTDAQTDYYLVKQAAVSIHMQELVQLHFRSLRPLLSLPEPARSGACTISVTFRSMAGDLLAGCRIPGSITVERQDGAGNAAETAADTVQDRRRQRTASEKFEVVTCRAGTSTHLSIKLALPSEPGYAWIEVRGANEAASSTRCGLYFYAVALHNGNRPVPDRADLEALELNWLPGVLESFPTLKSRRRRCLKGNFRAVAATEAGELQELTLVAQSLPSARLQRYAARIESYTRHET